jgi:hypothetical protein
MPLERIYSFEHGSNNVSRWMTWLPISLKNAAKCDKWYQLQNHSITESLNAKGAWEKLFTSHPRACRISVSNNKKETTQCQLLVSKSFLLKNTNRESNAWLKRKRNIYTQATLVFRFAIYLAEPEHFFFLPSSTTAFHRVALFGIREKRKPNYFSSFGIQQQNKTFVYRPECGRTTRRT